MMNQFITERNYTPSPQGSILVKKIEFSQSPDNLRLANTPDKIVKHQIFVNPNTNMNTKLNLNLNKQNVLTTPQRTVVVTQTPVLEVYTKPQVELKSNSNQLVTTQSKENLQMEKS